MAGHRRELRPQVFRPQGDVGVRAQEDAEDLEHGRLPGSVGWTVAFQETWRPVKPLRRFVRRGVNVLSLAAREWVMGVWAELPLTLTFYPTFYLTFALSLGLQKAEQRLGVRKVR